MQALDSLDGLVNSASEGEKVALAMLGVCCGLKDREREVKCGVFIVRPRRAQHSL